MTDNELKLAFEDLIELLDRIIGEIQLKAADQILISNVTGARNTLTKIENVYRFKDKIKCFVNEWQLIENDLNKESEDITQTEHGEEKLEKTEDPPTNSTKTITLAKEDYRIPVRIYNLDYHLGGKTRQASELLHEIRNKIKEMAPKMQEEYNKMYISFMDSQKFCEIHVQSNQLKIWLPPAIESLNDPQKRCRDVRGIGHYGTGATELFLWRMNDVEAVFDLIRQSYNIMKEHRY